MRAALLLTLLLFACTPGADERREENRFAAIGEGETLRFTGTEPFWGGEATGERLTYDTPENPDGTTIDVTRFSGLNGLSLSGELDGEAFDMAVSETPCSDGMSDRDYPFSIMLRIGDETRHGCGWTKARPFTGPANP